MSRAQRRRRPKSSPKAKLASPVAPGGRPLSGERQKEVPPTPQVTPHQEGQSQTSNSLPAPTQASSAGMTLSERRQLVVACVQAAAALIALGIATYTFTQQVSLNEQQQKLNEYSVVREERKYSTRVAIWSTAGDSVSSVLPAGINLSIQNRSPVPLRNVHVQGTLASGHIGDVALTDIPPCTIEMHRIAPPPGDTFAKTGGQSRGYSGLSLRFWVDNHSWRLTSDRLEKSAKAGEADRAHRLRSVPIDSIDTAPGTKGNDVPQAALVQDCGEGG